MHRAQIETRQSHDEVAPPPNAAPDEIAKLSAKLLANLETLSELPLYEDNRVDLLIDGPATYREMLEAIRTADDHVFLETYIFADDEVGREFASLLKDKSRDGVTVGIIYDSVGSIRSDGSFFDDMKNAGIRLSRGRRGVVHSRNEQSRLPQLPAQR